jgi:hypothetical protein
VNINKKGAVRFEPPPDRCNFQDAVVNLSLEKYTNIPEVTGKIKQYFRSSRGIKTFFIYKKRKGQPTYTHAGLSERKVDGLM